MRILKLDENTKKNILNDLLKRSPNNYDSYADVVAEIVNNVRAHYGRILPVFDAVIPSTVKLAEISTADKSIFKHGIKI